MPACTDRLASAYLLEVGEGSIITVLLTIDIQLSIEYHHPEIA